LRNGIFEIGHTAAPQRDTVIFLLSASALVPFLLPKHDEAERLRQGVLVGVFFGKLRIEGPGVLRVDILQGSHCAADGTFRCKNYVNPFLNYTKLGKLLQVLL
jgi:hypothetical protein